MKFSFKQSRILALALFWVVATTLWAPIGVLAHVGGESHEPATGFVHAQSLLAADEFCQMDDCTESVQNLQDCEFACQFFVENLTTEFRQIDMINSYGAASASFIRYPSLAELERPPKHSA